MLFYSLDEVRILDLCLLELVCANVPALNFFTIRTSLSLCLVDSKL